MQPVVEEATIIRLALIGCDYITSLGISRILADAAYIEVVATSALGQENYADVYQEQVDLVLLDTQTLGNELVKGCRWFSSRRRPPRVIILGDVSLDLAEQLFYAGASAILRRGAIAEDLPVALRMIYRDSIFAYDTAASTALKQRKKPETIFIERMKTLSERERAVADGIASGLTNSQLAERLFMSEAMIKVQVANLMAKFGANNRVQIAVFVTKATAY